MNINLIKKDLNKFLKLCSILDYELDDRFPKTYADASLQYMLNIIKFMDICGPLKINEDNNK